MSLKSTLRALLTLRKGVFTGLNKDTVGTEPFRLFDEWYREAREAGLYLPESMTLATSTPDGFPSARLILLKGHDERGFVFFTNYESRKAVELERNPQAALAIHWPVLQRQVRIEGTVEKTSEEDSVAYFRTRPRGSRIGAWASPQSAVIDDREQLERQVAEYEARYPGDDVPLPPYWGGYRLRPEHIEFWQGRANRLHDRFRFTRAGDGWTVERLAP
jgi:pyridoxamine 5'-phosphate oxidase